MSLESALDEERREVMALLEGRPSVPRPPRTESPLARAQSPAAAVSPVRSMLDIGPAPSSARHASVAGTGVGIATPYGSMLDPSSPRANRSSSRGPTSPPPSARSLASPRANPEAAYQFEMMPTIEAHSMPKRVSQGGKKKSKGAMSAIYGNSSDLHHGGTRDRERHNSLGGLLGKGKSGSPDPGRSASPGGRKLNTNSFNLMPDPKKYVTDSGKIVDMQSAYRRLSDAALLRSGGALSTLPVRKGSDPVKGESLAPGGGVRLAMDDFGDDEAAVDSSEDDDSDASSERGDWSSSKRRGRRRTRQSDETEKRGAEKKKPKSLLAAAEDERKEVSSSYKVRSLLEPTVTVTSPDGEKMTSKKTGVHPHTNFDQGGSGYSTPFSSDTEADFNEIKSAQQLAMNISPIHSSPEAHRCVRQVIRGKWRQFQEDAEKGLRRQRVYLVATDLSEEAAYALEWTIGTVLRDGDTLLAVYAVDEEIGVGGDSSGAGTSGGATAQQESDSLLKTLSSHGGLSNEGLGPGPSPLHNSVSASEADVSTMGKAEKERYQAAVEVSDRCVKLLRKTRLQVRVVVEVFHCKSPKHMITEVIDFLEPTLVILGSRGRSALKGVLLGSFSNYLVTKSSVPVMVARKRLRKHSKYKRKNLRLSNVLTNPTGKLANAKID
ncbi:uncharacterized protein BDR25DRAFT_56130 [Lindgomyces ingoldianus]|uniref:Uncharacterized protein n=1 Tax=Lindgomyces ingoldianus TaxID=673940 RepID=A0ACB6QQ05_9PLEO|nr:uncharacterized protein BDR25DRAFT_56130 [Lindgomyces ingoldianus]KAF2468610.1 hypothetical protein BDR25DRAFT_56130 [Lindgomyces ingoldianus]